MKKKSLVRRSFTLIEVVVVIIILVTLASVATPMYMNYIKKANVGAAQTQISMFEQAIEGYKLDMGSYPEGENGLEALVSNVDNNEKWNGPYIKSVPKDPWGNAYVYQCPGEHGDYDLYSLGAGGQNGGSGSVIGNWKDEEGTQR